MLLLRPLITPRAIELAQRRVFEKEKFFVGTKLAPFVAREPMRTLKAALLLAYEMNRFEDFQAEEEAVLRGCDTDTLRKRKKDKVIRPL